MTAGASSAAPGGLRVVLLHGGVDAPAWRGDARPAALADTPADGLADAIADAVAGAECVLVDAESVDPLPTARRVHQADADVQVVLVVATEARRRALERAMLFAPGIGELWLASPTEVAAALAERAAGVTRQRRRFRRTPT